jgi:hypothetical protein
MFDRLGQLWEEVLIPVAEEGIGDEQSAAVQRQLQSTGATLEEATGQLHLLRVVALFWVDIFIDIQYSY